MVLALFFYCSYSNAGTNQYGIDCDATPWYSSCQYDENSGEFINPEKDSDVTQHTISDDSYASVPLPFSFTLYDKTFVHSWMHSNGIISFLAVNNTATSPGTPYQSNFCCNGEDIEGILSGNYTGTNYYTGRSGNAHGIPYISYSIAALWTDLINLNKDLDGDGVNDNGFFTRKIDTTGDGSFDTMRYYWRNISEYRNNNTNNTFGVQINDSNVVEKHYFDIDIRNHSVTIAITGDLDKGDVEQYDYYHTSSATNYTTSNVQNLQTDSTTNPTSEIISFNLGAACTANPLISVYCTGYAEAYAALLYQQACASDPLYDSGCPGYAQAYYDQQCELNPLYDSGCSGYDTAYYNQQCNLDPLYDSGCTGYETAYYNQQCSLNPLYDSGCAGYETAYYNQQCSLDPLYDQGCTGYEEAYLEQQCMINPLYDTTCLGYDQAYFDQQCNIDSQYDSTCPNYVPLDVVDTGVDFDPVQDALEDDVTTDFTNATGIEIEGINTVPEVPEIVVVEVDTFEETVPEAIDDVASLENELEQEIFEQEFEEIETPTDAVEEEIETEDVAEDENTTTNDEETTKEEAKENTVESEEASDEVEVKKSKEESKQEKIKENTPSKEQKQKSKNQKMKLLIAKKANELTKKVEQAVTIEQQMLVQRQLLALISFVPGFDYNDKENKDAVGYPPKPTVDHHWARWFVNDPKYDELEALQYNLK